MSMEQGAIELKQFLAAWPEDQQDLKQCLLELRDEALGINNSAGSFVSREGISHSLRFALEPVPAGRERPVFFLTDAIDFEGSLMLSVCFYADEISDLEELGNEIPGALFSETGYCFDLEEYDADFMAYLKPRIHQAAESARGV